MKVYDTKEGILGLITTLEGLNQLIEMRREAGYNRGERLQGFFIGGWLFLDSCGNTMKSDLSLDEIRKRFPDLPAVMTQQEFGERYPNEFFSVHMDFIPPANIVCGECGKQWDITSVPDAIRVCKTETLSLSEFVGKTLREVKDAVSARNTDSIWSMSGNKMIRNDKHVDLAPRPGYETLAVNTDGWIYERDGIDDSYVIEPGDEGFFSVWYWYHSACQRERLAREQEQQFRDMFTRAGYEIRSIVAIPNEYCPDDTCCPPWFEVTTTIGTFKIGWRKDVINIDWSRFRRNFLRLFEDEDVTKDKHYIHAWGTDKAVEYLARIRKSLVLR